MEVQICKNPECGDYPYYGVAPHECFYKRGAEFTIGQSLVKPVNEWPDNFALEVLKGEKPEDVKYPNACGVYYCPDCKRGMPTNKLHMDK
jgi:hypothetical protein